MKMLRRWKFLKALYNESVERYGKAKGEYANTEVFSDIVDIFPPFIKKMLIDDGIRMVSEDGFENGEKHCEMNGVSIAKDDNGKYSILVSDKIRRRKFIFVREWKSLYDFVGHALGHVLLDAELDDEKAESFNRVYHLDNWLFKNTGIKNCNEYYAETVLCYLFYGDVLKTYAPATWRWIDREFDKMALNRLLTDYKVNGKFFPSVRPFVIGLERADRDVDDSSIGINGDGKANNAWIEEIITDSERADLIPTDDVIKEPEFLSTLENSKLDDNAVDILEEQADECGESSEPDQNLEQTNISDDADMPLSDPYDDIVDDSDEDVDPSSIFMHVSHEASNDEKNEEDEAVVELNAGNAIDDYDNGHDSTAIDFPLEDNQNNDEEADVHDAIIPGTDITMEDIVDAKDNKTDTISFTKLFAKEEVMEQHDDAEAAKDDDLIKNNDNGDVEKQHN